MIHRLLLLTVLLAATMIAPAAAQDAAEDCPDTLPSRLVVGELGKVTPGDDNNLRDAPSRNGARVGSIPEQSIFTVLDGPVCADGYAWWQIDFAGQTAWTVEAIDGEYTLEPLGVPAPEEFVEYDDFGVSFKIASALGFSNIEGETAEYSDFTGAPPRLFITFEPYGVMEVIPIHYFEELGYDTTLQTLRDVLSDPQPGREDELAKGLMFANAAQVARSRGLEVQFVNGVGYRYVARIEQDTFPISRLFDYIMFGLTDDGAYVVALHLFPVAITIFQLEPPSEEYLPFFSLDLDDPAFFPAYDAYMAEKGALIDAADADVFDPRLELFDLFVNSISIDSEAVSAALATLPTPEG